jgi:outer membrane protein
MDVAPLPGFAAPAGFSFLRRPSSLFQADIFMLDTDKKQPLRRARWLSGLAVGALMLPAAAQAETLQDALAKAYENNPTLTGARAGQRANDENVPIQKSQGLPEVGARSIIRKISSFPATPFSRPSAR